MATAHIAERTAQAVSQAMVTAGMTKSRLAEATGIPYSTLGRKLLGRTAFDLAELYVIAQALRVEPSSLLPTEFVTMKASA